jgi:hypothetical protein
MNYRLRSTDEGLLVLQVYEAPKTGPYEYERTGTWRDAKVTDIPVYDLFKSPESEKCCPSVQPWTPSPSYGGMQSYAETATCGGGAIG